MAAAGRVSEGGAVRATGRSLRDWLPILTWLPRYQRAWLPIDILAGLTVMALLVPEGMAYAELAGMPPQAAFYAAPIGLILFAVFGTSRQLVVAVSSAIAVMSFSIVSELAGPGTPEFMALTSALAILVGVVAMLGGVLRLGRIARFFSESVLTGFVSGLALVIMVKQVPKMLGLEAVEGNFWERTLDLIRHIPEAHLLTAVVGSTALALMVFLERRFHKVPAALVAMIYGIVVSALFQLDGLGVHIVGEIPAGLAGPRLPGVGLEAAPILIGGALGIAMVAFAEAIGPAKSFARSHGDRVNDDQELLGLGASNLGAGLFQGFSIGASLSKSAANDNAGAKTQMSGVVAAVLVILVALFFTPLFHDLPEATLAAIVVVAVAGMFKAGEMGRLFRVRRKDFLQASVALLAVLTFEVLPALAIAVVVSLTVLVLRASQAKLSELGRVSGRLSFRSLDTYPDNQRLPGLLILRPDEGIFFANAAALREEIRRRIESAGRPLKAVLVDLEMTNELDAPSAEALEETWRDLGALDLRLILSSVHGPVLAMMDRTGLTEKIGAGNVHATVLGGAMDYLHGDEDGLRLILEMVGETVEGLGQELKVLRAASTKKGSAPALQSVARAIAGLGEALRRVRRK
ncbi:MAG TPA: SulP family inorganic anion transporter [Anaerolineales bacterium]|nr:SulP family inorganic anion transporter [Anaerolineales bacterium]